MESNEIETKQDTQEEQNQLIQVQIDLSDWTRFDPKSMVPDVTAVGYSNYAVVQIMPRDVYIDFIQLPGIKKDGKVMVNTTRMYLTHSHAQKLAKSILEVLDRSYKDRHFDAYDPDE